jgi:hypothetical protein
LANGLVGEDLNEPPNSQRCNQCGIIKHTQWGEALLKWNGIHADENIPLLLWNAVRKGKASKWEPWHGGETPKSRHQHQMLVGEWEQTSTKRTKGCLHWKMVWL